MNVGYIARVAHEVNRAYCQSLGDESQPAWDDAPKWQRESAEAGVRFHLTHPDAGPEASHKSWLGVKRADGWVWGPVKDPETKQHPCMMPFEELPGEQQAKDYLFRSVVHALRDRALEPAPHLNFEALNDFCTTVHALNATWWRDPVTGERLKRNKGEMLMLMVSEIAEAMEGVRKDLMDDHLPHRKMEEVELADVVIRLFDYVGGHGFDLAGAVREKLTYNAIRADHKPEARAAANGKKF